MTVWVRRIYGSERGDTTTRESRIKREIGAQIHEGQEQTRRAMDSGFRRNNGQKLIRLYAKFTKAKKENREDKESGFRPGFSRGNPCSGGMTDGPSCFFVTFVDILYANKFLN